MTDKAKRIISIVIVSIILISSAVLIISCSAVKEYEYKYLEDAYEAGWFTEDDLKTIADYWNNDDRTLPDTSRLVCLWAAWAPYSALQSSIRSFAGILSFSSLT